MTETLIGTWRPRVKMYAQDSRLRATFATTQREGYIMLPRGPKGATGAAGEDSRPWILSGSAANEAALPTWTLTDRKKAIYLEDSGQIAYWTGTQWIIGGMLSRPGDDGPPLRLTVGTVETTEVGGSATAELNDVDSGKELSLTIPRGPVGDAGAAGPANNITLGADVAQVTPEDGAALTWSNGQWLPSVPWPPAQVLNIGFGDMFQENITATSQAVGGLTIPAAPYPSRLIVGGALSVYQETKSYRWFIYTYTFLPEITATLIQTVNGEQTTIARGQRFDVSGMGDVPLVAYSPDSIDTAPGVALIPADTQAEVSLILTREDGNSHPARIFGGSVMIMRLPITV